MSSQTVSSTVQLQFIGRKHISFWTPISLLSTFEIICSIFLFVQVFSLFETEFRTSNLRESNFRTQYAREKKHSTVYAILIERVQNVLGSPLNDQKRNLPNAELKRNIKQIRTNSSGDHRGFVRKFENSLMRIQSTLHTWYSEPV